MIRDIRIRNFKSIQNAHLSFDSPNQPDNKFKNLLVLVGQNGSGKSNFVDAIQFSVDALQYNFNRAFEDRGGFQSVYHANAKLPDPIGFEVHLQSGGLHYLWGYERAEPSDNNYSVKNEWFFNGESNVIEEDFLNKKNKNIEKVSLNEILNGFFLSNEKCYTIKKGKRAEKTNFSIEDSAALLLFPGFHFSADIPIETRKLASNIFQFSFYSLFPNTLKKPQRPKNSKSMERHGKNWAATLKSLNKDEEGRELIAALGQLVGDIDDYRVIEAGGYLIPEFHHRGDGEGSWRGAREESDGTVRLAGLLTALLQKPTPTLICLEEPELGVHPGSLRLLMDFVRQALHDTQVIITTHSPELIDLVPPECLRVVTREGGASKVSRLHPDQMEMLKKHLCTSSELWGMEGLLPTDEPDTVPEAVPDDAPAAPQDASAHDE
jgi:predicted ATPase